MTETCKYRWITKSVFPAFEILEFSLEYHIETNKRINVHVFNSALMGWGITEQFAKIVELTQPKQTKVTFTFSLDTEYMLSTLVINKLSLPSKCYMF